MNNLLHQPVTVEPYDDNFGATVIGYSLGLVVGKSYTLKMTPLGGNQVTKVVTAVDGEAPDTLQIAGAVELGDYGSNPIMIGDMLVAVCDKAQIVAGDVAPAEDKTVFYIARTTDDPPITITFDSIEENT